MINPTCTIAAPFSWASGQITITNQTPTGFTIKTGTTAHADLPIAAP